MKIGILSMQRVINYGSFLQAFSLYSILTELGYDVQFVDYEVGKVIIEKTKSNNKVSKFNELCTKFSDRILYPRKLNRDVLNNYFDEMQGLEGLFKNEYFPLLGIDEKQNILPDIDLLLIGSDEVFNCIQSNPNVGYSKQLFGEGTNAKVIASYAASFGNTKLEGLKKYNIADELAHMLGKFNFISVRDKNSGNIVQNLLRKNVEYNLDPVFIYDYPQVDKETVKLKNYIVVYGYAKRFSQKESKAILNFAKKHNKTVICLLAPQTYIGNYVAANPFETLAYIKNADYVITDTFHGTVFSIKYNKKFAVFVRGGNENKYGNNEKLYDLLERFNFTSKKVSELKNMENILDDEIDTQRINNIIAKEREKSIDYLNRVCNQKVDK